MRSRPTNPFVALAVTLLLAAAAPAAEVWIGGSRAWGDYTTPGNEGQWTFLQKNVDGLYINNFAMRPAEDKIGPKRADRIAGMQRLLANKKVIYETDLQHATDAFDADAIKQLTDAGFDYAGVTINRGTDESRTKIITRDGQVPLYFMLAPWKIHGDINKPENQEARDNVLKFAGASIDGPVVVFRDTQSGRTNKAASYSLIKWCHANDKKFLWLLAPNDSGPGFLKEAQDIVRQTEDNDAHPDIWAVAFYGPQAFREKLEVLPEADADGQPTTTFSGVPYWLIHHLRDPKKWATLTMPDQPGVRVKGNAYAVDLPSGGSRTVTVDLSNQSRWLDLVPVVRLRSATMSAPVRATVGDRDVTADLLGKGLTFNRELRLNPGDRHTLTLHFADNATNTATNDAATAWRLELSPHPSEKDRVNQTIRLDVAPAGETVAEARPN